MPATIVVALNEPQLTDGVVRELNNQGYSAAGFSTSMRALDALEAANKVEVLVTCVVHQPDNPNGIALARMTRSKKPGTKVLFIGDPDHASYAEGLGSLLMWPVTAAQVVEATVKLMAPPPPG